MNVAHKATTTPVLYRYFLRLLLTDVYFHVNIDSRCRINTKYRYQHGAIGLGWSGLIATAFGSSALDCVQLCQPCTTEELMLVARPCAMITAPMLMVAKRLGLQLVV